mgnify:CR=1 FL=1
MEITKIFAEEKMKIPSSFTHKIKQKEAQERKEQRKETDNEQKRSLFLKQHKGRETKLYPEKLELCKKIFTWRKEFLATPEGAALFKKTCSDLWIAGGNWGYTIPQFGGAGCWSRIYLNKKGIYYWEGYKWMGGGASFTFTNPEEMTKLHYDYLNKIWK